MDLKNQNNASSDVQLSRLDFKAPRGEGADYTDMFSIKAFYQVINAIVASALSLK